MNSHFGIGTIGSLSLGDNAVEYSIGNDMEVRYVRSNH